MKTKTKWIISITSGIMLLLIGGIFLYIKNSNKVFTQPEYIKEVIVQNESFNDLLDEYLDQVISYNYTAEETQKLEKTAERFTTFVNNLETKLKPHVSSESKNHYNQMIAAYKIYLEAIEMYKKAVPKNLGEERNQLLKEARDKLKKAKEAMNNIK